MKHLLLINNYMFQPHNYDIKNNIRVKKNKNK